ncbi:hypothetical protein B9T26_08105 [Acinetobacter sp. ANC 4169]|jgi:hypothetical protein|uniref:hypothetical protein n=1 Tax=Acinetobacter sp. ANC 4169 TaxID=1977879 RepID=UPI000A33B3C8|nr:hypothetical protein [Acinetobacter sp. ANC 4169]OTG73710.1 hypothetical protein B9T26_08105 [Acinetobacter sp. ANC 4169]
MISNKQTALFLKQLREQYPIAFKRNYLFYSMIKTKGILDELKELIPWVLAAMIFISLSMSLSPYIASQFPQFNAFRAQGIAVLAIMLLFMLYTPIVIKQIKHSSTSLYQQLRHTPVKLALLIVLQTLNIAYIESTVLQIILFFFALSFGFVRFYKENMFREGTQNEQYFYLQETRRICFWAYKQVLKIQFKSLFTSKNSTARHTLRQQEKKFIDLHIQLIRYENELCKIHKHVDVETYLDSLM